MPCHCRNTVKRVLSVAKALSQAHTHTHAFKHRLWRRSCPFVMSFVFFPTSSTKKFTQLWNHISQMAALRRKEPSSCRENIIAGLTSVWKCSHWVFLWFPEKYTPLRNYHPHQSPWSSMATLSKHTLRHSSYFHNNQHGTFRPEYIINKCTKWTHCWQVDDYCPVLFLDSYTVLSGACKYLAYNVMLVFKYIFNSFFVTCVLGFKNDPLLTSVDKLTALFEDIKGSVMFAQRRKCPLLFALDDAQVMNIRPQIYIKVSFQMEGLGKSIWILSMTIPSPSELNLIGGRLCLLLKALIGSSSLFITKFCSTYVTETRQRDRTNLWFSLWCVW